MSDEELDRMATVGEELSWHLACIVGTLLAVGFIYHLARHILRVIYS